MHTDPIRGHKRGTAPVPLSVLDLAPVGSGLTVAQALATTTAVAKRTEELGYHRFWVAEHHSMPGIASSAPAVILAHLAAHTERIRLGSGGVMLPNHAPLVIAEQFGTLEALAPGRVDLGLGRAPGTDRATTLALRLTPERLGADDFPEQLAELTAFLDGSFPENHPYHRIHAVPGPVQRRVDGGVGEHSRPPVWLLGSSDYSARLAASLGLPFAFAHHFSADNTVPALDLYRRTFRASSVLDKPYAMIAATAVAADTEKDAARAAASLGLSMLKLRTGRAGLVPSAQEAEDFPYTPAERDFVAQWMSNAVTGTGAQVREGLDALVERTGADELMVTSTVHGHEPRLRSYELIAEAYGL
ncbi:LLM class flavin-dependent oxidoreductase [Phytomonospora sp. NPDC050363]|uniref:LLM class flavin-dependent oxidoreductase n=1 Tax=Phytomonospora sp. NPDC050363 TaxID=3155642 RepID=UPI0033C36BC1